MIFYVLSKVDKFNINILSNEALALNITITFLLFKNASVFDVILRATLFAHYSLKYKSLTWCTIPAFPNDILWSHFLGHG